MHYIMAKVLFHFDVELAPSSARWMERMSVYIIWKKPPMEVFLHCVER
jgi:hypothetical protein